MKGPTLIINLASPLSHKDIKSKHTTSPLDPQQNVPHYMDRHLSVLERPGWIYSSLLIRSTCAEQALSLPGVAQHTQSCALCTDKKKKSVMF